MRKWYERPQVPDYNFTAERHVYRVTMTRQTLFCSPDGQAVVGSETVLRCESVRTS